MLGQNISNDLVKVDAAAVAGYLGAANNDGVIRTGTGTTYADGGNFVTLSPDLVGDATAGRVLRIVLLTIEDGTNANTIKCTLDTVWNGDIITITDNIAKDATTGDWSLSATGETLTIEASGLSGNCIGAIGVLKHCGTGNYLGDADPTANDINVSVRNLDTAQDLTALVQDGEIWINIFYITDA
jgi:hypothetical protein